MAGSVYYLKAAPVEYNSIEAKMNRELASNLKGDILSFQEIKKGMKIHLHSLIATFPHKNAKPKPEEVFVTIAFPRSQLNEQYLFSMFSRINAMVHQSQPFAHPGIESILYQDWMTVTIHDGVMLHLQNGVPSSPDLRVFTSTNAGV